MAALLGIGDGIFATQLSVLLAMLFKHDTVYKCYYYFLKLKSCPINIDLHRDIMISAKTTL